MIEIREELLTPVADRVLVRLDEADELTPGGIYVPGAEPPCTGTVVAVGPGRRDDSSSRVPMDLFEGDRVLLPKFAGTQVTVCGVVHAILREHEVLCRVGDTGSL